MCSGIHHGKLYIAVLALLVTACPLNALAEEAVPSEMSASEAPEFLGVWVLSLEFRGRPAQMILHVVDLDGKMGATLDSLQQPESKAIEAIEKGEPGVKFKYRMKFGQREFPLIIDLHLEDDRAVGTLGDENGIFSTDVTGVRHLGDPESLLEGGLRPAPTDARLTINDKKIKITFGDLSVDGPDFKALERMRTGDILQFTKSRASKLFTGVDLKFSDAIIKAGNVAESYPGVYSLWLKKTDDGWRLIFNDQADIWGTRHRAESDVAEVPLSVSTLEEPADTFVYRLEGKGDGGTLRVAWGDMEWSAPFTVAQ